MDLFVLLCMHVQLILFGRNLGHHHDTAIVDITILVDEKQRTSCEHKQGHTSPEQQLKVTNGIFNLACITKIAGWLTFAYITFIVALAIWHAFTTTTAAGSTIQTGIFCDIACITFLQSLWYTTFAKMMSITCRRKDDSNQVAFVGMKLLEIGYHSLYYASVQSQQHVHKIIRYNLYIPLGLSHRQRVVLLDIEKIVYHMPFQEAIYPVSFNQCMLFTLGTAIVIYL